jgi:hypothetical protein
MFLTILNIRSHSASDFALEGRVERRVQFWRCGEVKLAFAIQVSLETPPGLAHGRRQQLAGSQTSVLIVDYDAKVSWVEGSSPPCL